MSPGCRLYYITDRRAFGGDEAVKQARLLQQISAAAHAGVDFIQLREKDLPPRELESLARRAMDAVRSARAQSQTRLLINSRTDIALAVGADGVHLRSDDAGVRQVRGVAASVGATEFLVAVSCHSLDEVQRAQDDGANFAVLAPVFEKKDAPDSVPMGLESLHRASQAKLPVYALGGITMENARACLEAGAAGIAAIRLFQENPIAEVVRRLRAM
jgi:thiamine-phosphate pyrophosphorylase